MAILFLGTAVIFGLFSADAAYAHGWQRSVPAGIIAVLALAAAVYTSK